MSFIDPAVRQAAADMVSRSNFAFATELHEKLAVGDGNLVFSPFSISLILLMARFGARGRTANQIETAMKLPLSNNLVELIPTRQGFFKIVERVRDPVEEYKVTVASRIYTEGGFLFDKEFRRISKQVLDLTVDQVDFSDGVNASESINSWVKNRTNGKINQLFSPDSFNGNTKLVLLNAIYFKSPWKFPFDSEDTERAPFYTMNQQFPVDMMVAEDAFQYGDLPELNAKIIFLTYKAPQKPASKPRGRFSMHIIIPKHTFGLKRALKALKNMSMDYLRKNVRKPSLCETVRLHLPKFKIESTLDLAKPLQEMGLTDMFSETEADFSGIPQNASTAPKLFVSDIVQKAYIAVDEEGTEAASATEIRAGVTCFPTVTEIKADRPFYYQIVEDETNTVFFAGVVRNPNA